MIKMNKPPETNKLNANAVGAGLVSAQRGITLIALIITIIILLILAGVTINILIGENGLFNIARQASEDYKIEAAREKISIAIAEYQVKMKKETIYSILNKIEGLQGIEPDDEQAGLPYTVIVDGYEFLITDKLEIEYQGKADGKKPEVIKVSKKVIDDENVEIEIQAKTEDKEGLEKLILIKNGIEIKEEAVNGNNITKTFNVVGNGTYKIKVVGKNKKREVSEEIKVTEIKTMSGEIEAGTVTEGKVLLTVTGEIKEDTVEKIEIYEKNSKTLVTTISKEKIKTTENSETNKTEIEAEHEIEYIGFYEEKEYYAKIIGNKGSIDTVNTAKPKNIDTIKTVEDLERLAIQVNEKDNTFLNKTINLEGDITTKANWVPIGYYDGSGTNSDGVFLGKRFSGTFEGNGHTITVTSLSKDGKYKSSGLFGQIIGGTVRNLTVDGTMDAECGLIGGITGGIQNGTLSRCVNNSDITNINGIYQGGIVGSATNSLVEGCRNNGTIYGKTRVGGIAGDINYNSRVSYCTNTSKVECYGTESIKFGNRPKEVYGIVGGIVGSSDNSLIDYSTNKVGAEVSGNSSTILPNGLIGGGIAGLATNNSKINLSDNEGVITYNSLTEYENNIGGLSGIVGCLMESTVDQCYNTGSVTSIYGTNNGLIGVGGIVGYADSSTIKNTYNTGSVKGGENVGGVVGQMFKAYGLSGDNCLYNSYNISDSVEAASNIAVHNFSGCTSNVNFYCCSWYKEEVNKYYDENSTYDSIKEYDTLEDMKASGEELLNSLKNKEGMSGENYVWGLDSNINHGLPYLIYNH